MKRLSRSSSLVIFPAFLLCGLIAFGDTIKLKNGSVLKGKVIAYNQQEFTIVPDLGTISRRSATKITIAAEDIESIEFENTDSVNPQSSSPTTPVQQTAGKYGDLQREPSQPVRTSPPASEATAEPENNPPVTTSNPAPVTETQVSGTPIEKSVSVAATSDWTSTEIRVQRGQKISISATGEVDLGNNQRTSPGGLSATPDNRKLMTNKPTGALIAVVGDDNDDFVYIGRSGDFTAAHNGILFLSVNEGNLKDNTGSFLARIRVTSK